MRRPLISAKGMASLPPRRGEWLGCEVREMVNEESKLMGVSRLAGGNRSISRDFEQDKSEAGGETEETEMTFFIVIVWG